MDVSNEELRAKRWLKLNRITPSTNPNQTLGIATVMDGYGFPLWECRTLELPWKDNKNRISCYPEGVYRVKKRTSQKYGLHFHIQDVPGRSFILWHAANFVRQLLGCTAVGSMHTDIDGDGLRDVTSSKKTLIQLLELLPDEFELIVERNPRE